MNPTEIKQMSAAEKKSIIERADLALDSIRPHLAVDGGNVEVVNLTDEMVLQVKWLGNCRSCSMSEMTMKAGIEQTVLSKLPEIKSVEAISDLN